MTIDGLERFGSSIDIKREKREQTNDYVNRLGRQIVKVYGVPGHVVSSALDEVLLYESHEYETLGSEAVEIIEVAYMRYRKSLVRQQKPDS